MRDQVHMETIKSIPAVGGTATALYGKVHDLDWTVIAAQATVVYIGLQILYLLWKWRREAKKRG